MLHILDFHVQNCIGVVVTLAKICVASTFKQLYFCVPYRDNHYECSCIQNLDFFMGQHCVYISCQNDFMINTI